ncbi:MAG: hypothetical protein ACKVPX_14155 [Myxococcaceae bacterium]
MHKLLNACIAAVVIAGAGCSDVIKYGRLLGFVVDGQSGQRLNLFTTNGSVANVTDDSSATNQVYAVVEGRLKRAIPCGQGDATEANLLSAEGCYRIEGVPVNQDVPVFAQYTGYARFHGTTFIDSNKYSADDVNFPDPQQIGNIRMFPVGFGTDVRFFTLDNDNGRTLSGVQVVCQYDPDDGNQFEGDGDDFISPESTTSGGIRATTDGSGTAVIPGAQLVMGADYNCQFYLSSATNQRVLTESYSFTAGVDGPDFYVALQTGDILDSDPLYAVYANNQNSETVFGANGNLVVVMNIPAEIIPGTLDCQRADINWSDTDGDLSAAPTLPANVFNNGTSETMTATFSSDGRTLTLATRALTTPYDTGDLGTSVDFNGVWIRPVNNLELVRAHRYIGSSGTGSTSCSIGQSHNWDSLDSWWGFDNEITLF